MRKYNGLHENPGICPKCNSECLTYGASELDGESLYYPFTCDDCGFEGKEWYNVVFECFTDDNGDEIHSRINNYNCDGCQGDKTCSIDEEVRMLPITDYSNLILCKNHYEQEIDWRIERNRDLEKSAQFDTPKWEDLKIYTNE